MLLIELFKQTVPYEETNAGDHFVFEVEDEKYELTFDDVYTETLIKMITRSKQQHIVPPEILEELSQEEKIKEVEFTSDYGYDLSGTGNAYKVFATVIEIINEHMHRTNEKYLTFAAKEGSR